MIPYIHLNLHFWQPQIPTFGLMLWLALAVGAVVLAPVCCYRSAGSTAGSSGGGGGDGIDPLPPSRPRGGIPLPDAEQSGARVRDHVRPKLRDASPRRPAREPTR